MYVFDSLYYDIKINLIQFKCSRIELIIFALLRNQLFMVAALDYLSVLENHNCVAVPYGG